MLLALCVTSSIATAQTPPTPTSVVPSYLPIGKMAIAEALAKAGKVEIFTSAPSADENFLVLLDFDDVQSTQDIIDKLDEVQPFVEINDPKDTITTTATIYNRDCTKKLFIGTASFKMEKVGYDSDGEPVYQTPAHAGFLYFELLFGWMPFPGATEAWAVDLNGQWLNLRCANEQILIPGWMNLSNISEIVINGVWRYDMNTGLLLTPQGSRTKFCEVYFEGLRQAYADSDGTVRIYAQPRYGYVQLTEYKNTKGVFRLDFTSGEQYDYTKPIVVRVATLDDLKSGRGWKTYNFPEDGLELDLPVGIYYIYPEYDTKDFGWGIPTIIAQG